MLSKTEIEAANWYTLTERGWAGHYILSGRCLFRRNTLIEYGFHKIIISTVGNLVDDTIPERPVIQMGVMPGHFYETMAFYADRRSKYFDANVRKPVKINMSTVITKHGKDIEANKMHEAVVKEIIDRIFKGNL